MNSRMTKRKTEALNYLSERTVPGIATLNELRARSFRDHGITPDSRSLADHKKSYNRTFLEYSAPFEVFNLSEQGRGISRELTVGMFARWAAWELIEKGLLTAFPSENVEFYIGHDACTAVTKMPDKSYATIGTASYRKTITFVSYDYRDEMLAQFSKTPWVIKGSAKGNKWKELDDQFRVMDLGWLPSYFPLEDGSFISMAKVTYRLF